MELSNLKVELENTDIIYKLFLDSLLSYLDEYDLDKECYFYHFKNFDFKLGYVLNSAYNSEGIFIRSISTIIKGPKRFIVKENSDNYESLMIHYDLFKEHDEESLNETFILFKLQLKNLFLKLNNPLCYCFQCKKILFNLVETQNKVLCEDCIHFNYEIIGCDMCCKKEENAIFITECCEKKIHLECIAHWTKCILTYKGPEYDIWCPECSSSLQRQSNYKEINDYLKLI
jgi:hypothetical protein